MISWRGCSRITCSSGVHRFGSINRNDAGKQSNAASFADRLTLFNEMLFTPKFMPSMHCNNNKNAHKRQLERRLYGGPTDFELKVLNFCPASPRPDCGRVSALRRPAQRFAFWRLRERPRVHAKMVSDFVTKCSLPFGTRAQFCPIFWRFRDL